MHAISKDLSSFESNGLRLTYPGRVLLAVLCVLGLSFEGITSICSEVDVDMMGNTLSAWIRFISPLPFALPARTSWSGLSSTPASFSPKSSSAYPTSNGWRLEAADDVEEALAKTLADDLTYQHRPIRRLVDISICFWAAARQLALQPSLQKGNGMFVSVSGSWRLAGVVWHVVTIVALQVVAAAKTNTLTVSKCRIILRYLQPVYWLLIALVVGENIGLQLGSIVAGLGLGSMALAMGSQEVMKDIVGPVTMLFDRPFDVDDVVVIRQKQDRPRRGDRAAADALRDLRRRNAARAQPGHQQDPRGQLRQRAATVPAHHRRLLAEPGDPARRARASTKSPSS